MRLPPRESPRRISPALPAQALDACRWANRFICRNIHVRRRRHETAAGLLRRRTIDAVSWTSLR